LRLCEALADEHDLIFVLNDLAAIETTSAVKTIRTIAADLLDVDRAGSISQDDRRSAVELLPHHFQPPQYCDRSIIMCHDLHVFDIPWKYGERAPQLQQSFRRNLLAASAVITEFPRTYYTVERTAEVALTNLYLTESPLLLDVGTQPLFASSRLVNQTAIPELLYPAQMQLHKNHEGLARGVAELKRSGLTVKITCPGSDLDVPTTSFIKSAVHELGVAESFEFLGRIADEELTDLYRRCDAVIVPSVAEGGAYVALEAIAFGKPVAVNSIDAARLHLDSHTAQVIWFDAGDPVQTADAMRSLICADPAEWGHKNARCRERLAALSWDSVASKWSAVIGMVEGRLPRPVVAIDRHASEIVYA
jgi:glycosyltransferase involved in cell wall biosynthesis